LVVHTGFVLERLRSYRRQLSLRRGAGLDSVAHRGEQADVLRHPDHHESDEDLPLPGCENIHRVPDGRGQRVSGRPWKLDRG
jgi:hypothetical protein